MAKPNSTVSNWRKNNPNTKAIKAIQDRKAKEPMIMDMDKLTKGEMSPEEFKKKWMPSTT